MSDDVLSLLAGRKLDVKVAEALGVAKRVRLPEMVLNPAFFTDPSSGIKMYEQQGEAEYLVPADWDGKSNVGVHAALDDGLRIGFSVAPYSTSGDEAVALVHRFGIWTCPDEDSPGAEGWQVGVPIGRYAKAPTIPHAVARWVARYVKNGEVSE